MGGSRRICECDVVELEGRLPIAIVGESQAGLVTNIDWGLSFDLKSESSQILDGSGRSDEMRDDRCKDEEQVDEVVECLIVSIRPKR